MEIEFSQAFPLVARLLLDGVQVSQGLVDQALFLLAQSVSSDFDVKLVLNIARSKYGGQFRAIVWKAFSEGARNLESLGLSLLAIGQAEMDWLEPPGLVDLELIARVELLLMSDEPRVRATGLLAACRLAHRCSKSPGIRVDALSCFFPYAKAAVQARTAWEQHCGARLLVELSETGVVTVEESRELLPKLFEILRHSMVREVQVAVQRSIAALPLLGRDDSASLSPPPEDIYQVLNHKDLPLAALIATFYWQSPDQEKFLVSTRERMRGYIGRSCINRNIVLISRQMNPSGLE
jgi:hypothetical protein